MKKMMFLCLACFTISFLFAEITSIYEIQYTTQALDGTYPSLFLNKHVQTEGVVTAVNKDKSIAFIQAKSGAWQGMMLQGQIQHLKMGDKLNVSGIVKERNGMTYLRVAKIQVVAQYQAIPKPVNITSFELARSEEYESVLVQLRDVVADKNHVRAGLFRVQDASGKCVIRNDLDLASLPIHQGEEFHTIVGVVSFSFGNFALNPRIKRDINQRVVQIQNTSWGKVKSMYK